jgi:hypothetical protein
MNVIMYEMEKNKRISSPLLNSNFLGGFCSRALMNDNEILIEYTILNTNKNINIVLILSILFSVI